MASIRKKRSSQFWHACITLPNGKQKQFSTGLTDKKEALAVASAAERVCRKQVIPHQLRYALSRLADDFVPADDAEVASWLRSWADGKRGEVAPRNPMFRPFRRLILSASEIGASQSSSICPHRQRIRNSRSCAMLWAMLPRQKS